MMATASSLACVITPDARRFAARYVGAPCCLGAGSHFFFPVHDAGITPSRGVGRPVNRAALPGGEDPRA